MAGQDIKGTDTDDVAFRFFDLPRELRNYIYRHLYVPCKTTPGSQHGVSGQTIRLKHFCLPALLTVDRRFRREYEEETFRFAEATIIACDVRDLDISGFLQSQLPGQFQKLQHVTMRVRAWYWKTYDPGVHCESEQCWQRAVKSLAAEVDRVLLHLKALRTLTLEVYGRPEHLETSMLNLGFDHLQLFAKDFTEARKKPPTAASVQVTSAYLLDARLYVANENTIMDERVADAMTYHWDNCIQYRATRAEVGSDSWYGLDLQTQHAGTYDYERVLDEHREALAEEEDDGSGSDDYEIDEEDDEAAETDENHEDDKVAADDDDESSDDGEETVGS